MDFGATGSARPFDPAALDAPDMALEPPGMFAQPSGMPAEPSDMRSTSKRSRGAKIDPAFLAAARELRDRYLERVNAEPGALSGCGKYAVARALPAPRAPRADGPAPRVLLEAA